MTTEALPDGPAQAEEDREHGGGGDEVGDQEQAEHVVALAGR